MRQQESVPVPRGWTREAAWKGAGGSLLLHLFAGAAMVVALSGPSKTPPQVIDLTLLPPAGIARRPVPPAFVAAVKPSRTPGPGTAVLQDPPAHPASPPVANPPDVTVPPIRYDGTVPASPSDPAVKESAPAPGSPHPPAEVSPTTGQDPAPTASGSSPGASGARPPAEDFAWLRDAIQRAIAYPATARRMGWEGTVVVAFQLLSDGSVRDVHIVQGSGHAALDRGAIDAVRNASPFARSPVKAEVITPVVYRLTR